MGLQVEEAAQRMWRECFVWRQLPNRQTFQRIHRELCVSESVYASRCDVSCGKYHRMPAVEETVLWAVEDNTATRRRTVEHALHRSSSTIWTTLSGDEMLPYYLQRVEPLKSGEIRYSIIS